MSQIHPLTLFLEVQTLLTQFSEDISSAKFDNLASRVQTYSLKLQTLCKIHPDFAISTILLKTPSLYSVTHSMDVGIVCEMIGQQLNVPPPQRILLINAALTMDISMISLQNRLFSHQGPLDEKSKKLIQFHPKLSAQLLRKIGIDNQLWINSVLYHNTSLEVAAAKDQEALPQYVSLLMMADVYTAMISPREYRPGLAPDKVAKEVFIKRGQYVNSAVSSMFIKTFGIYPPGTVIKLKTGETAVATRTTKDPQRPELSIISDKNQQPISPPKPIDGEYAIDSALRPALNNSHIDTPSLWNLNSPQDDDTQPQQTTDEALDSMQGPSPEELKRAYEAIKGVEIPPIPQTIFDLRAEISKEEPDMDKIAELVSTEIVLSGIVMKTVNSPLFGLASKVTSIKHAMMVMGIKRFNDLVLASALKKAIGGEDDDPRMHQFWAESSAVGHCASRIASLVEDADREEAYMAGLFQACGSLFLAKKFPDYSDTMLPRAFISPFSVISEENKVYGTNHATVSFLMAKHWQLPVSTCLSIYHHHTQPLSKLNDDKVRAFAAILALSTMIVEWVCFAKHEETAERVAYREQAISELYISEAEVEEIQLDITDMLLKEIES